jgi:hypothetical protein
MKHIVGFSLPLDCILVYAPRDEAEAEVAIAAVKILVQLIMRSREGGVGVRADSHKLWRIRCGFG